jgi:hypothetical protein
MSNALRISPEEYRRRLEALQTRIRRADLVGGILHSDTVLVTKDGHEMLTRYLIELSSLVTRGLKPLTRFKGKLAEQAPGLRKGALV